MICFELAKDAGNFRNGDEGFDGSRQNAIADKFRELYAKNHVFKRRWFAFSELASPKYNAENIFIYFTAFEPIAKIEANEKVTKSDINNVKQKLNNADIWLISPTFSAAIFFVYTDEQLKRYEDSPEKQQWADAYFDVLKQYDEFGYFKREMFGISVDSKQNFDENYSSNWYYYYK